MKSLPTYLTLKILSNHQGPRTRKKAHTKSCLKQISQDAKEVFSSTDISSLKHQKIDSGLSKRKQLNVWLPFKF